MRRRRAGGSGTRSTTSATSSPTRRSGWRRGDGDRWSRSTRRERRRRTSSAWGGGSCRSRASAIAERPPAAPLRLEEEQTYYEILETEPGVSDEEVRRAYRSIKDIYASGSLVVAGLYDEHELAELHARVNAAHDTLFAPERRRLYDLALPEADLARAVRAAAQRGPADARRRAARPEERPEVSEAIIDPGAEVTGAFLKKLRETRGIELGDIAQRTKISERYLRAIEDERFSDMPAAVYVRGYVMEYARAVRIDAQRVAESYLARYRAQLAKTAAASDGRQATRLARLLLARGELLPGVLVRSRAGVDSWMVSVRLAASVSWSVWPERGCCRSARHRRTATARPMRRP